MITKRLERLLKLAIVLQTDQAFTVNELWNRLGVSRRTLFRDLAALRSVGIIYLFDRESQAFRLEQSDLRDSVGFSDAEAVAIMLLSENMCGVGFMPDWAAASSAGLKLRAIIPRKQQDRISSILKTVRVRKAYDSTEPSQEDILAALQHAAMCRQKVQIDYAPDNGDGARRFSVHPYFVFFSDEKWDLIGLDPACQQVGSYRVSRITRVKAYQEWFFESPVGQDAVW